MPEWWSSWEKQIALSACFGALFSPLLFNTWLEAGLRLQLHPPSRYYGNTIWAYQDLKPKDILDNNTIAAQPGYLRDLDLRGEIWGVADWESKSSLFLCLPHTPTQSGLAFHLSGSGTMLGIELFLCLTFLLFIKYVKKRWFWLSWVDFLVSKKKKKNFIVDRARWM